MTAAYAPSTINLALQLDNAELTELTDTLEERIGQLHDAGDSVRAKRAEDLFRKVSVAASQPLELESYRVGDHVEAFDWEIGDQRKLWFAGKVTHCGVFPGGRYMVAVKLTGEHPPAPLYAMITEPRDIRRIG